MTRSSMDFHIAMIFLAGCLHAPTATQLTNINLDEELVDFSADAQSHKVVLMK